MTPSTSTNLSTTATTTAALPPIHGQQNIKRKPVVSSQKSATISSGSRKRYEAVLGLKNDDTIKDSYTTKKVRFFYVKKTTLISLNIDNNSNIFCIITR
jgi:hypothetical protein